MAERSAPQGNSTSCYGAAMKTLLLFCALASGCGGTPGNSSGGLLGGWQTTLASVVVTVTFSGSATSGTVETMQSTAVSGDLATCRTDLIGTGPFTVSGTSVTLTATSARQKTAGCTNPDTDTPLTDISAQMNFAGALSGPFVLTDTTLMLGTSYPTLTRK